MNEFERRIRQLINSLGTRASRRWHDSARFVRRQRAAGTASIRHQATASAQRAATRVRDFRESERGQRAASTLHDLRDSGAAKRAGTALHDLRDSGAAKRAGAALHDLRQREPVKKAEENARKVMHDRFSGGSGHSGTADSA